MCKPFRLHVVGRAVRENHDECTAISQEAKSSGFFSDEYVVGIVRISPDPRRPFSGPCYSIVICENYARVAEACVIEELFDV